jgi:hypothetical protein
MRQYQGLGWCQHIPLARSLISNLRCKIGTAGKIWSASIAIPVSHTSSNADPESHYQGYHLPSGSAARSVKDGMEMRITEFGYTKPGNSELTPWHLMNEQTSRRNADDAHGASHISGSISPSISSGQRLKEDWNTRLLCRKRA